MPENQKKIILDNMEPQAARPQFEVKTFSEDQLYKIKKKNYAKKVLKYLQEHVWLIYYGIFILFFLGLLALIVMTPKTPPPKPKQPSMNLIIPAPVTTNANYQSQRPSPS
jgi:multidrug efflux pump subunit AcrB